MNTYFEKLLPVHTPERAQYLLTQGIESPKVVQADGAVGATHPFLAGVTVPLLKVCPSPRGEGARDALCAAVRVKELYFRNLHTLKYEVVDVSLLPQSLFFNEVSGQWETQVLRLELDIHFDGEEESCKITVCGLLRRNLGEIKIVDQTINTPSGEHYRLVGYTLNAERAITVWPYAA